MYASGNGFLEVVRTLLEGGAFLNAQNNVRNQLMMIMMIMVVVVLNDEDRDVCRLC